jgi:excisionase family DNA binding protein
MARAKPRTKDLKITTKGEKTMKALKTIPEAAEILRISHWTVRKDIRDGKLIPVRLGRRVLLEEAELERFVAERKGSQDEVHHGQ